MFADLFGMAGFGASSAPEWERMPGRGRDVQAEITVPLEEADEGGERTLEIGLPGQAARSVRIRFSRRGRWPAPASARTGQCGAGRTGRPDPDRQNRAALFFRLDGHDIYLDLPLAPWEAVLGTQVTVPTSMAVRLHPGGCEGWQEAAALRPGIQASQERAGDFYAVMRIVVPDSPGEEERGLFEKLAEVSGFDPRFQLSALTAIPEKAVEPRRTRRKQRNSNGLARQHLTRRLRHLN
jgi:curved DNA-binding protein